MSIKSFAVSLSLNELQYGSLCYILISRQVITYKLGQRLHGQKESYIMSFAARHNKGSKFNIDTEGWTEYRDLKSLYKEDPDAIRPVHGFYINRKSQYGDAPVIISDGFFVNCPQHMLSDVKEILQSAEDIADINDGKVGFKVRTYEAKNYKNKKCYGVEFVDM